MKDRSLEARRSATTQGQLDKKRDDTAAAKDARIAELEAVAKLALRYLEHPDVLEITRAMALSGDAVVERLRSALEPQ